MMVRAWNPAVGDVLYSVSADVEDDGKCSIAVGEWVVRTIQMRSTERLVAVGRVMTAFLVQRNEVTWIKEKGKSQRYSWAASIDAAWRRRHPVGGELPCGLYTTPRQALVAELEVIELRQRRQRDYFTTDAAEQQALDNLFAKLKTQVNARISRIDNEAAAKRRRRINATDTHGRATK